MPVSPYYAQNSYGTRKYARSSSSGNLAGMGTTYYSPGDVKGIGNDHASDYFRTKYIIPEDGPAKSYLTARYNCPPRGAFHLTRLDSSDNLYERRNQIEGNRLKKSSSSSSFLTGSTAGYTRSNTASDTFGRTLPYSPKTRPFTSNLASPTETTPGRLHGDRKFPGRCGGESRYARAYLDRINKGRDDRPREIDTRDINTSVPRTPKWLKITKSEDDAGDITRDRQVVRLTIKREKPVPQDPFTIRDKRMQTIAQRLLEKYQVPEKKTDYSELKLGVKKTLNPELSPPQAETSTVNSQAVSSKPPKPISSSTPATPVSDVKENPLAHKISSMASGTIPRTPHCVGEDKEDMSLVLQRATTTAETKEELESWQEVKDAIYAAVLHPDVDIESDEEMNKLIEGEPPNSSTSATDEVKMKFEEPRRDSMDKGLAIVGQLKRFVKQHESPSCSKKKPSKKSKKCKEGNAPDQNDEVIVPKPKESPQQKHTCAPAITEASSEREKKEKVLKSENTTVERIADSKTAMNSMTVGKEGGLTFCSTQNGKKTGKERENFNPPASQVLDKEEMPCNNTTKAIRGHMEQYLKIPEKTGCDTEEKLQDVSPSKSESKGVSSVLSADLVLGSQRHEQQDKIAETPTELKNKQTNIKKNQTESAVNEEPKEVSTSKIPKFKKISKSVAQTKEVREDTFKVNDTPESPSSGLVLLSPSSTSPAELPSTHDGLKEMQKEKSRDTHAQARSADNQTFDRQVETPSALETLKSIMREEVECVAAKDSSTGGKTKQVTAGNSTKDAAVKLETSRDRGSCLAEGHNIEKSAKVESSEHLEEVEKGRGAKNLNSSASKQEDEGKPAEVGKKEIKTTKDQKRIENVTAKDSSRTIPQTLLEQGKKINESKPDPLTKVSLNSKRMTKEKTVVTEAEAKLKNKEEIKIVKREETTSIVNKEETKPDSEKKAESLEIKQNNNHDTAQVNATVKGEEHRDESKASNLTVVDSNEQNRDKDDVTNLKGKAKPSPTSSEGAGAERGPPPNTLPVKRVLKKPRQVALPPVSEKNTANELLNARNILKRPVRPGAAKPTENSKQDSESGTRSAWKKHISQLALPSQDGQSGEVKNVKRSGNEKDEPKVKAAPSDAELKEPENKVVSGTSGDTESKEFGECGKGMRGRVPRKQKLTSPRSASSSSSSDDEGSTVRKKIEKPKKIIKHVSGIKKTPSPKGGADTPGVPENITQSKTPSASIPLTSFSGGNAESEENHEGCDVRTTKKDGHIAETSTQGVTADVEEKVERQGGAKQASGVENIEPGVVKVQFGLEDGQADKLHTQTNLKEVAAAKVGLVGASQSADSGYGSSPSTPLPTATPAVPIKDEDEEKCDGK